MRQARRWQLSKQGLVRVPSWLVAFRWTTRALLAPLYLFGALSTIDRFIRSRFRPRILPAAIRFVPSRSRAMGRARRFLKTQRGLATLRPAGSVRSRSWPIAPFSTLLPCRLSLASARPMRPRPGFTRPPLAPKRAPTPGRLPTLSGFRVAIRSRLWATWPWTSIRRRVAAPWPGTPIRRRRPAVLPRTSV